MNMKTTVTRQELFDLVWAKPTTHVATEYGVLPIAVLRACKALGVPWPSAGHWSRVKHGRPPPRPALGPPPAGAPATADLRNWMPRSRQAKEVVRPQLGLRAEEAPVKWHPVIQKTRAAFRGGTPDYKYGTLITNADHPHLRLVVTRSSLDRALAAMNQLVWILERNGFTFVMPEKGETVIKLVYVSTSTVLDFFLKEDIERSERTPTPEEKKSIYLFDRWSYRGTGRLRLNISEYYPEGARKSWGDGKNAKLEDKLIDAGPDFAICAQGKHAHELEMAERQRRWDEEERLRRLAEEKKRKEEERRAVLFTASQNWSRIEGLRAFRVACEARLRSTRKGEALKPQQEEWLRWVDLVIQETDPLTAGFLKRLEDTPS